MSKSRPDIPSDLAMWAAASLVEGESLADVVAALVAERVPEADAARLCASFYSDDPGFEAARWVHQRLRTLESMLTVRQELAMRSGRRSEIVRRSGVDSDTFRDDHYAPGGPVVLTDVCERWARWQLDTVVDTIGKADVEVLSGRAVDTALLGDAGGGPYRWRAPLTAFLDESTAVPLESRSGMICDPDVLARPEAGPLWEGVELDDRYLTTTPERVLEAGDEPHPGASVAVTTESTPESRHGALWVGVAGSATPLHHTRSNQLVAITAGRFAVTLISPLDTHCLYNTSGAFSPVDPRSPDEIRYPRYLQIQPVEVVAYAGEALYIPVGWWYAVEALETAIAVSFTNLVLPNRFDVFEPDLDS